MDFGDYYVMPYSTLPDFWRMTKRTFCNALSLEGVNNYFNLIIENAEACNYVYGVTDP